MLTGNSAGNTLNGGLGIDTLLGGEDNDVLDGGPRQRHAGRSRTAGDTATFANASGRNSAPAGGLQITLGQNGAAGRVVHFSETDTLRSIENVIGSFLRRCVLFGNEQANTFDGGNGND